MQNVQGEHSAILSTFIKLPFVIKIFVLFIFEWPFYTCFTVYFERKKSEDNKKLPSMQRVKQINFINVKSVGLGKHCKPRSYNIEYKHVDPISIASQHKILKYLEQIWQLMNKCLNYIPINDTTFELFVFWPSDTEN